MKHLSDLSYICLPPFISAVGLILLCRQQLESEAELATETDRNIHVMFEILKRKKKVKIERLILNRSSFAQTIENLFALSFLVKDGRVEIYVEDGSQVVGIFISLVALIKSLLIVLYIVLHVYTSSSFAAAPRNGPSAEEIGTGVIENCQFMFRFDFNDSKVEVI